MKSILAILLWSAMIIVLMYGMIAEVELRELKADRWLFNQILTDKALYKRQAAREWTR